MSEPFIWSSERDAPDPSWAVLTHIGPSCHSNPTRIQHLTRTRKRVGLRKSWGGRGSGREREGRRSSVVQTNNGMRSAALRACRVAAIQFPHLGSHVLSALMQPDAIRYFRKSGPDREKRSVLSHIRCGRAERSHTCQKNYSEGCGPDRSADFL
jgi:hypothetical protein